MLLSGIILANKKTTDFYNFLQNPNVKGADIETWHRSVLKTVENIILGLLSLPISLFLLLAIIAGFYIKRPRTCYFIAAFICLGFNVGQLIFIFHEKLYEKL